MIKQLAKCIREYKWASLAAPLFVTMEVVMEVIIPTFMGKILDNGINGNGGEGNIPYVYRIGIVLVVFALISLTFGILAGQAASKASTGFAKNLRHDMFHNIQSFSFANIDRFSSASLVTRMTTDVTNLQNAYQMLVRMAFRAPAMLIFSVVMSFAINPKLALIYAAVIPFLGLGLFLVVKHAHPIFERVFRRYDSLNRVVSENLRGIRVVKSFVREDYEKEKFNTASTDIYNDFTSAERLLALNSPMMQISAYTAMLLLSWFGAKIIVNSSGTELTTGTLFTLFSYTSQILMNLMALSMIFVMLTMSRAAAERICEVLGETSTLTSGDDAIRDIPDGSIEFSGVSFSYSGDVERLCLKNVDLKIDPGQVIGIIGSTGSAKTTLVQLIPRLYDVTEGTVKVGGNDVRDYDLKALRDSVAMVLQKNVLFSGTIADNLRWGNENATDDELREACALAHADEFIDKLPDGMETMIDEGGTNVSGGQKQRLCIARSLLKKPKILIMDDSTSAVDTATDRKIRSAMKEYIPETTKIIIAQRISSIESADRIIVMDDGKVDDFGTHEELLERNAVYREVFESQRKGESSNG